MDDCKYNTAESSGVSQTAEQVAEVIVNCIESSNPPLRCRTSAWAENFCRFKTQSDPTGKLQQDEVARNVLGAKSCSELK
jgi:hypothetical protein